MSRRSLLLVAGLVVALGVLAAAMALGRAPESGPALAPTSAAQATPALDPNAPPFAGQPVAVAYAASCASCHGEDREGGAIGPPLLPSRLTMSDDVYFTAIKEGRPGTAMPGWGTTFSDAEIRALVAYIRQPPAAGVAQGEPNEAVTAREEPGRPAVATADRVVTPAGFTTTLLARMPEGKQPTAIAYAPDGTLTVAVLAGEIYRLTEDGRLSVFAGPFSFPLGLAWRGDELYVSTLSDKVTPPPGAQCPPNDRLGRVLALRDADGDGRADQTRVIIPDLPVGLNARHLVNGLAFGLDGMLYVANGTCENRRRTTDDPRRGTIQRYTPDGRIPADNPDPTSPVIATGLRNPYGLAVHPVDGSLFATDNGRDDLGDDLPPEELNHIRFGPGEPIRAYGWPECYGDGRGNECQDTEPPIAELEPHASANGLTVYTGDQFGPEYKHNIFIAYYGAGNPGRRPYGRKVARVELTRSGSTYQARVTDFAVGFERPLTVLTAANGGLIVADFGPIGGTGAVYRIDRVANANPFARVPPPSSDGAPEYIAETGHTMAADFARHWRRNGGLERFGYPISQEMMEDGVLVQYFERARLERAIAMRCPDRRPPLTPEQCQDLRVRVSPLGRVVATSRAAEPPFARVAPFPNDAERRYFPETGHSLAHGFRRYWEANGGARGFGLPLSEEFVEREAATGRGVTVQYFERARLEYHPAPDGGSGTIQLGRLGAEVAAQRYR